jgi:DNA-directed RNA polymerase specialized sigma24 family protein
VEFAVTNIVLLELLPSLRAFAQWLTGNSETADTLARQTLAQAWQFRATYVPGTNLKAWLFSILRSQLKLDHYAPRSSEKMAVRA